MSDPISPFQANPPAPKTIIRSLVVAAVGAALALVFIILPAEYGIDPTGAGKAAGLTELNAPAQTLEISDVVGGNEVLREVEIPDFGKPLPLPNPEVFQKQESAAREQVFVVTLQPNEQTEIKMLLKSGKMIEYAWEVDSGQVYADFHGHDPVLGDNFWVRYEENQVGKQSAGSLVAPFSGEHGWYFLNYNSSPVTVTLTVDGFYEELIDYGVSIDA